MGRHGKLLVIAPGQRARSIDRANSACPIIKGAGLCRYDAIRCAAQKQPRRCKCLNDCKLTTAGSRWPGKQ
ncbi:hypothetical protein C4K18_3452 [Pseudomonas chlororaphis subsp. aurantiaca]|nr:hypothetical protein C4K18_3452 [Pseudomonas chlororaphis subsp. aurantiaca]